MFFEKRPSKTHYNLNISIFIDGTVVNNSDAATVKHNVFEHRPSKTHRKMQTYKFIDGTVVKNSGMTFNNTKFSYVFLFKLAF